MKWTDPDEEGLVAFLVRDKGFKYAAPRLPRMSRPSPVVRDPARSEERVRSGAKKLVKARGAGTQGRLDDFFIRTPSTASPKRKVPTGLLLPAPPPPAPLVATVVVWSRPHPTMTAPSALARTPNRRQRARPRRRGSPSPDGGHDSGRLEA